jgi:hypothetical protein
MASKYDVNTTGGCIELLENLYRNAQDPRFGLLCDDIFDSQQATELKERLQDKVIIPLALIRDRIKTANQALKKILPKGEQEKYEAALKGHNITDNQNPIRQLLDITSDEHLEGIRSHLIDVIEILQAHCDNIDECGRGSDEEIEELADGDHELIHHVREFQEKTKKKDYQRSSKIERIQDTLKNLEPIRDELGFYDASIEIIGTTLTERLNLMRTRMFQTRRK